jgi:aspartyl/glutamyl-tRNA(Asn/Gln) amidotransferase C subunit
MADLQNRLDMAIQAIKIEIDEAEGRKLCSELEELLKWLEPLLAVDTTGTGQVLISHGAVNVLREDRSKNGCMADLQESAPDFVEGFYMVPPIIE